MAERKTVFMSIGTDVIHGGHIEIISQAAQLGELTVGVLTDVCRWWPPTNVIRSCPVRNG